MSSLIPVFMVVGCDHLDYNSWEGIFKVILGGTSATNRQGKVIVIKNKNKNVIQRVKKKLVAINYEMCMKVFFLKLITIYIYIYITIIIMNFLY